MSEDSPRTVLVTGASGLLGWPLCLELARRGHTVLMMVRRNRRRNVRERVDAISPRSLGRRLKILVGDLNEDGLFDTRTRNRANKADTVIHCAGLTDPAVDRTLAYRTHVEGTAALLAFAADLEGLRRFVHVSCTSVAGGHRGLWTEDMLLEGQAFAAPGPESKLVAERRVRTSKLPFTIVRPSMLVGDRLDSPNGLTHLFRLLLRIAGLPRPLRRLPVAPLGGCARVDAVPVGWVVTATLALLEAEADGTFHLNDPHAPTMRAFLDRVCPQLGIAPPAADLPRRLALPLWRSGPLAPARSLLDQALNLPPETMAAMGTCAAVDPTRAERVLRPRGLRPPRFDDWIDGAVEYARAHLV